MDYRFFHWENSVLLCVRYCIKDWGLALKQLFYVLLAALLCIKYEQSIAAEPLMIVAEDWAPMSYRVNDQPTGYVIELIQVLQLQLSRTDPIVFLPWARANLLGQSQKNVLLIAMAKNHQRESRFSFVGPIAEGSMGIFVLKDDPIKLDNLNDLTNQGDIGVYREGDCQQTLKDSHVSQLAVANYPDQSVKQLVLSRVRFLCQADFGVPFTLNQIGKRKSDVRMAYKIKDLAIYFAFSDGTSPALIQQWHQALSQFMQTPEYTALYQKWFETDLHPNEPKLFTVNH
jgi:polar amino acid transport system substrate-binding protein